MPDKLKQLIEKLYIYWNILQKNQTIKIAGVAFLFTGFVLLGYVLDYIGDGVARKPLLEPEGIKRETKSRLEHKSDLKLESRPNSKPFTESERERSEPQSTTVSMKEDWPGENQRILLAMAISGEARGEPYIGQVAVGAVILNRVRNPKFPNTIGGVIYQPGAFTAVADGQIYLPPDKNAFRAAQDALNGWDPTGGALYYYNPAKATSRWIWTRPQITVIGKHIFTK